MNTEKKIVLYVSNVADILNISRRQAYTLFAKPDFPKIRIGNRYCVRKDRFYSWIEAQAKEDKNEKEKQDQSK